ncbi:MAG: helix-turn-helix domain-containing protein [Candidatus Methylomirabilis sp.]|nr:helix-turn-helix domain-containing protein [Deltaproteobacteria bacterium]
MPIWPLNDRLKARRLLRGLNQKEVAALAGLKRHRYNDFERGHITPTRPELERLARVLDVHEPFLREGSDWGTTSRRDKLPYSTVGERRSWRPEQKAPTASHIITALRLYREQTLRCLERIKQREDIPVVRRFLREVACHSVLEALLILALLALGANPVWEAPLRVGFRHWPVLLRRRQAGDCRHPGLQLEFLGVRILVLFQVTLQLAPGSIQVDALVALRSPGESNRWVVGEVDGPLHVQEDDEARGLRHGLPEVRLANPLFKMGDPAVTLCRRALEIMQVDMSPEAVEQRLERRRRRDRAA